MNNPFNQLTNDKKVYLASDFHLGSPDHASSLDREKKVVRWLNAIHPTCAGLILAGDIFDFWFEYRHVVPKGYLRLLGKLSEFTDAGIPVIFFTGNHDLWMNSYFSDELNITIYHGPESFQIGKNLIHIAHGDGLGPGDHVFKFNKRIFKNPMAQWLFRWMHPDLGIALANRWSGHSRKKSFEKPDPFLGDQEYLVRYSTEMEKKQHHDYYIYGHRHLVLTMKIGEQATYLNPGDWIDKCHYIQMDGSSAEIKSFE